MRIVYNTRRPSRKSRRKPFRPTPREWSEIIRPRTAVSVVVIGISILILLTAIFGQNGFLALHHQRQALERLETQRERARQEQQRLKKEIDELRSPEGVERIAREEGQMGKQGEIVVVLPSNHGANNSSHNSGAAHSGADPSQNSPNPTKKQ
ncbi:MAG: septum formation initiator family protein [Acidobacteriia bacterium]|nr:septum formation initiator family protein [Terriglobia bacterium]